MLKSDIFINFINNLKKVSKTKDQTELFEKEFTPINCELYKQIIQLTLNGYRIYGITDDAAKEIIKVNNNLDSDENLEKYLNILSNESLSKEEIKKQFKELNLELTENQLKIVCNILYGSFSCGCSSDIFDKFVPLKESGLPKWEAIMAKDFSKDIDKLIEMILEDNKNGKTWNMQPKLDGFRSITIMKDGEFIESWSPRNMKKINKQTLQNLIYDLEINSKIPEGTVIFDGELGTRTDSPKDMFATIGEYRKKDHVVQKPLYTVFDMLVGGFDSKKPYCERYSDLEKMTTNYPTLSIKQIPITCLPSNINAKNLKDIILEEAARFIELGYEGAILRCDDDPYIQGRTKRLVKVKPFFDSEFKVIGFEKTTKFMTIYQKEVECVGSLLVEGIVDSKKVISNVGSGITDKERIDWLNSPELIFNKEVTIKYQEIIKSVDSENYSLRFPVYKCIREV